jgi:MFS family permease
MGTQPSASNGSRIMTISLVIVALGLPSILYWADRTGFGVILPAIIKTLHLSVAIGAGLATIFALGQVVAAPFSGYISRRLGGAATILLGVSIFSLFTMTTGLSKTPSQIFFSRTLTGVGEALFYPVAAALMAGLTLRFRGLANGVANLLQGIGVFTGPVLVAYVFVATNSYVTTLVYIGIIGVIIGLISSGLIFKSGHSGSSIKPSTKQRSESQSRGYMNKDSAVGLTLMTLIGFIQWPWLVLFSAYLQFVDHLSVAQSAAAAGLIGIGFIVAALGGYVGDTKIDRRLLIALGSAGEVVITLIAFRVHLGFLEAASLAALFGIFSSSLAFTNILAISQNSVPQEHIPTITGIILGGYYGAGFLSGFFVGELIHTVGWGGATAVVVALPALISAGLGFGIRSDRAASKILKVEP